jgi:PAS domain S-box-containing protein
VSLSISPIKDTTGKIIGASKIIRDVTARKQAEEKLVAATAKFESVFNQSGIFAGITDVDGNLREVNALAVETGGYTREQVLDRPFSEAPWWRGSEEVQARIRLATEQAAAGEVFRETLTYWLADGSERIVDFAMHPIRDESGAVRFLHPTGIDITERKRAETNLAFLASLTAALTPLAGAVEIASVAARMISLHYGTARASFAKVDLTADEITVFASSFAALTDDRTTHRLSVYLGAEALQALRRGQTIVIPDVGRDPLTAQSAPSHDAWGVASLMVSPHFVAGKLAAVLAVGAAGTRAWRDDERALLADVTVRVFNRVERARAEESLRALEAEEREIAVGLQRALLPGRLAPAPGLAFAARYEAGSDVLVVGGDWYDVFILPSGRVALTVGDVVGHGLAAAAAMGQLRTALAALSEHADGPGELLTRLDGFLARSRATDFATVCYGVLDPISGVLEYASAGHPPMLLVSPAGEPNWLTDGQSAPLYGEGPPVRAQAATVLEPGSLLLLYSDGLVERRGESLSRGLARLSTAARSLAGVPVAEVCDCLVAALGVESSRDDDVVVLALRLSPVKASTFHRSFPADPKELRELRLVMRAWLEENEVAQEVRHPLLLSVGEACTNSIEHAYADGEPGVVEVDVAAEDDGSLLIEVRDAGHFRPVSAPNPERGRGTDIVRGLTADFTRESTAAGTTVRFRIPVSESLPA